MLGDIVTRWEHKLDVHHIGAQLLLDTHIHLMIVVLAVVRQSARKADEKFRNFVASMLAALVPGLCYMLEHFAGPVGEHTPGVFPVRRAPSAPSALFDPFDPSALSLSVFLFALLLPFPCPVSPARHIHSADHVYLQTQVSGMVARAYLGPQEAGQRYLLSSRNHWVGVANRVRERAED
jgi:hypothetical protein